MVAPSLIRTSVGHFLLLLLFPCLLVSASLSPRRQTVSRELLSRRHKHMKRFSRIVHRETLRTRVFGSSVRPASCIKIGECILGSWHDRTSQCTVPCCPHKVRLPLKNCEERTIKSLSAGTLCSWQAVKSGMAWMTGPGMGACIRVVRRNGRKGERLCVVREESDSIEGLAVFSGSVACQARHVVDRCRCGGAVAGDEGQPRDI
ncbi:hypothetical protein QBC45DRAFT_112473 [Copromyces sp. CBS 386.78]|nr:hypothetical protein QBC45DRAFT_112473 [Copromyces sp. CBS 386.78]